MRYVIKSAAGYFTEMVVAQSTPILAPMDMTLHPGHPPVEKGEQIGTETLYKPVFEAFKPSQAVQFDTRADAEGQIANVSGTPLMDAGAFDGCTVEEST